MSRGFGSDNHSGVHPEIWQALAEANYGHAPSYGTDTWSDGANAVFRKHFGKEAQVFFVFNGTAANALALKALNQSFQSVLCSDVSHLQVDECGAPEFFIGGKLVPLPSVDGKLTMESLQKALIRRGDQHHSQPGAISLTQPTELGTVYSLKEIQEICQWARQSGLKVHLDGSRLSNAVTHLKTSFKEMTTDLGIDVISMGGTKNGFMFGEAVIFLNSLLAPHFRYIRKQCGQLPSKTRFIAASFKKYLDGDLWKQISLHECQMAELLFQRMSALSGIRLTRPRESNAVFARIPKPIFKKLREAGFFFYVWDELTFECRLMTSWDTTASDIELFTEKLRSLL